jgi:hypothetical protein
VTQSTGIGRGSRGKYKCTMSDEIKPDTFWAYEDKRRYELYKVQCAQHLRDLILVYRTDIKLPSYLAPVAEIAAPTFEAVE